MADYYPLISRAVAGLEKNTGEARRAVYERARGALLAQLRGVTPALNESDITRERLALEEAIRKVEAESARQFVDTSRTPQPPPRLRPAEPEAPRAQPRDDAFRAAARPAAASPRPRAPEPDQWDEAPRAPVAPPQRRPAPPPQARQEQARQDTATALRRPGPPLPPAPPMPGPRQSESMFDQPLPSEPAPPRHPLRGQDRRSLSDSGLKDFRDVVSEANELGGAPARAERSAREAYAAVPAPAPEFNRREAQFDRADARIYEQPEATEPQPHEDFSQPMLEPSFAVEDSRPVPPKARRAAPASIEDEQDFEHEQVEPRRSYAGLMRVAAAVVIVVALLGLAVWQWPNMVGLYRAFRAPSTDVATREQPSTAARSKIPDRIEPGTSPQEQQPGVAAGAAVAQKVVLYEEQDSSSPEGKRYVGSALWRTETVSPGPGQPPELAIRADVEVPERKLAMTWSLRRNTDKNLPASHTVEIIFKLPADFQPGGIQSVPGIMMKQAEQTRGVPLAGTVVKVTSGYFLVGLSALDSDKERNIQLLKERTWFDMPVVYNNSRRAIIAMEKGTPGERVFAEAFRVWKQ
jgi:hypothetical protein